MRSLGIFAVSWPIAAVLCLGGPEISAAQGTTNPAATMPTAAGNPAPAEYREGYEPEAVQTMPFIERLGPLYRAAVRRFYIDDFYLAVFVRPVQYGLSAFV